MKSERERQIPHDTPSTWSLTYGTNEPSTKEKAHREQTCGCQKEGEREEPTLMLGGTGGRRRRGRQRMRWLDGITDLMDVESE